MPALVSRWLQRYRRKRAASLRKATAKMAGRRCLSFCQLLSSSAFPVTGPLYKGENVNP